MKRLIGVATAAAVSMALVGSQAWGSAATVRPTASSATGTQLHFLDASRNSTPAAGAPKSGAPRPGDRVFLRDALFAWKSATTHGPAAGSVRSTLTFMSGFGPHGATIGLSGQLFVQGGSLLAEGTGRVTQGPSRFTLPVIGGTGRYAGARGTLTLRDIGASGDRSEVTIDLLP